MIVTTKHLFTIPGFSSRRGFCRRGAMAWFAEHGLSWRDFVRNGIDAERLIETGDALGIALADWARQCEDHHG